jgi:hypothetical protein
MPSQFSKPYDALLQLKDAGAVTADAAAQVGGSNQILDLGVGRVDAKVKLQVTALDVASGDERYVLTMQGSNSATFASGIVNLGSKQFGDSSVTLESADSVVGEYEFAVTNDQNGSLYRYVRMYTDVSGTTPSINYVAWLVPQT